MTRTLSVDDGGNQFGEPVARAVAHDERFLVNRHGEPAVIIMSVTDFVDTLAPPPDWLKEIQEDARIHEVDKWTGSHMAAEIASTRRDRRRKHDNLAQCQVENRFRTDCQPSTARTR
jgi:prevent-host-death family protein